MLRWLYVDFNSYFASVEQQMEPRLRGKPVAVLPVDTDSTCAIAASYEAKAFGIRTGTPIYEAKKRCKDLICVLARHEHYVDFHHRIIEEIGNHLPVAAVCSIDEMACRLMANEAPPEIARGFAEKIKRGLASHIGEYVRCSIGISTNRYLAKLSTDLQKPDGLVTLFPEELPGRINHLSLRDFPGIGYNMEARLNRAGIYDVPALWALSSAHMRKLWHSLEGDRFWHALRGVDLPEQTTSRSSIGHSHVISPEFRDQESARLVARRLTLKVASRLRRIEHRARRFTLSVRIENGPRWAGEAACTSSCDSFTFLHALERLWEIMHIEHPRARIKKASVVLHALDPAHVLQQDLLTPFDSTEEKARQRGEKLGFAMDKLNQKYGRNTVMIGDVMVQPGHFTGTKVAFTRIPDMEEFKE